MEVWGVPTSRVQGLVIDRRGPRRSHYTYHRGEGELEADRIHSCHCRCRDFPFPGVSACFYHRFIIKIQPSIPVISEWGFLQELTAAEGAPAWFTHDATLIVLGTLSLVEFLAQKNQNLR